MNKRWQQFGDVSQRKYSCIGARQRNIPSASLQQASTSDGQCSVDRSTGSSCNTPRPSQDLRIHLNRNFNYTGVEEKEQPDVEEEEESEYDLRSRINNRNNSNYTGVEEEEEPHDVEEEEPEYDLRSRINNRNQLKYYTVVTVVEEEEEPENDLRSRIKRSRSSSGVGVIYPEQDLRSVLNIKSITSSMAAQADDDSSDIANSGKC